MADSLICRTLINSVREAKDVVQEGMSDSNQTPPSHYHTIISSHPHMHTRTRTHSRTQQQERQKRGISVLLVHSTVAKTAPYVQPKGRVAHLQSHCPCPTIGFEPFFSLMNCCAMGSLFFDSALGRKQRESQTFHFKGERTKNHDGPLMDMSLECSTPRRVWHEKNRKEQKEFTEVFMHKL